MANSAFVSWIAEPSCKSLDAGMQALSKAWQRYNDNGGLDDKVINQLDRASIALDKSSAAFDYAELYTCAAILEELKEILGSIKEGRPPTFGFDAISYALVRLPAYVRLVATGAPDLSGALFDVLNVVRLVQGKGPLVDRNWTSRISFDDIELRRGKSDIEGVALSFSNFLKTEVVPGLPFFLDSDDLFFVLEELESHLHSLLDVELSQRLNLLTWLIQAIVANAKLHPKRLDLLTVLALSEACRIYLSSFSQDVTESNEGEISDDFLQLLCLIIGYARDRSESAEQLLVRLHVLDAFHQKEDVEFLRIQLGGANLTSMEDVYPVLLDELAVSERQLNLSSTNGRFKGDRFVDACEEIGRIGSTLEILGDVALASELRSRAGQLLAIYRKPGPVEDVSKAFGDLVDTILFTRRALDTKLHGDGPGIFADLPIDPSTVRTFLKEARADLRTIRQKLGLHFETGEAHAKLLASVRSLGTLSSGLTILDLGDTANVVRHLAIFLHSAISENEAVEGERLKQTAMALTAVETRLEYLARGLLPPDRYISCAKEALSQLLGDQFSEALPPLPASFVDCEAEEPASASDMVPIVHSIVSASEAWDGTRNSKWQGLVNLFSELAIMASLLDYRIVTRLSRDIVDIASEVSTAATWPEELAEMSFDYVNAVAKALAIATSDDPQLPQNCIQDLTDKKELLRGRLGAEIEADRFIGLVDSQEAPKEQKTADVDNEHAQAESQIDHELLGVFLQEYEKLSGTLHEALDDFEAVPEAAVPSVGLIHCCHTLKGVSHTIERPEMAEIFGLWEDILNERQSENVALNSEEIALYKQSVEGADACAKGVRAGLKFPNADDLLSRLRTSYAGRDSIEEPSLGNEMEPELLFTEGDQLSDDSSFDVIPVDAEETILDESTISDPGKPEIEIDGFVPHDGQYDEEMLALYLEEAQSELYRLDDLIGELDQNPSDEALHVEIKRLMHTLKGSSNMAGATTIGFVTHELEELLSGLEVGSINPDTLFVRLLSAGMDTLRKLTHVAEQRLSLPTPWNLLAAIQYGNDNDSLAEELVSNALKESISISTIPTREPITSQINQTDEAEDEIRAVSPKLTLVPGNGAPEVDDQGPNSSPKAPDKSSVTSKRPGGAKVRRVTPSILEIKEKESFLETLDRLRQIRAEQRQSVGGGAGTPPKVKVDTELLDELIDSAFEVNVDRDRVVLYQETMERSETVLRKLTDHVESMQASLFAELQKIDSYHRDHPELLAPDYLDHFSALKALNRDLHETSAGIRQVQEQIKEQTGQARTTIKKLTKTTRSLRENLFNTRLVPIKNILSSLRTVTNKTAEMVNKSLTFNMEGETTQIDRNLLDTLTNNRVLEHLIRNCGDHGIESAQEREAKGKSITGTIVLKAMHEGDRIFLKLRDDGGGIDPEKVKAKAVEKGLISAGAELTDHELLQLVTASGFSTASTVTQVSGRGVGMDVVRATIENLGGTLSINSILGEGTEFVLDLPYTQGVSRALVLKVGEACFAIPTTVIHSFGYVAKDSLSEFSVEFEGKDYDLISLSAICGLEGERQTFVPGQKAGLVIINDQTRPFAVACESIEGMQALHLKSVPFFKDTLKGVLGLAETIDGLLLTVIDPRELRSTMISLGGEGFRTKPGLSRKSPTQCKPLAIVADDSVALRKSATRFLERIGYQVITAHNGREAMNLMDSCYPSILVTDLEMPQMDGFELTRSVRGNRTVGQLPVVMVTSRNTEEIEREAFEAGVNCFLPKPFNAEMLAEAVKAATSMEVQTS